MKTTELKNVKIDGIVYHNIEVHGLDMLFWLTDFKDEYGFGEYARVITDVCFDLIIIHLYGGVIEIDTHNKDWESVEKQVKEHILNDKEFMQEWQDREFSE